MFLLRRASRYGAVLKFRTLWSVLRRRTVKNVMTGKQSWYIHINVVDYLTQIRGGLRRQDSCAIWTTFDGSRDLNDTFNSDELEIDRSSKVFLRWTENRLLP